MHVVFVSATGLATLIEARPGQTLMQAAVSNGVPGIIGECGGSAICGTCHVYVEEKFLDRLSRPQAVEVELLDCAAVELRSNSRLACQIVLQPELDGMIVHTPVSQSPG